MKVINLGTPLRAAEIIDELGKKRLAYDDVRFQNVHLKKINDLIGRRVFTKNDLFMDAGGLWDILQEEDGTIGRYHHHHGLSPTFIISALSFLQDPELVILECQTHRYIVVTLSVDGKAVLAVIETDAPLRNNRNANINKLVTLYEKNDFPDYLRRIKKRTEARIIYKKREPNGAPIASLGFSTKNIRLVITIVKSVKPTIWRERIDRNVALYETLDSGKAYQGGESIFPDFGRIGKTGLENAKEGWSAITKLRISRERCLGAFLLKIPKGSF